MNRRAFLFSLGALLLTLTTLPGLAQPAQHPARRYLVRGTILALSPTSVTVKGHDRHEGDEISRTLKIDSKSQVEDGLKVGDQVVADYNHTMENNVYVLLTLRRSTPARPGRRP